MKKSLKFLALDKNVYINIPKDTIPYLKEGDKIKITERGQAKINIKTFSRENIQARETIFTVRLID